MQAKRQARPLDNQCPSSILDYLGPSRIFSSDGRVASFSVVGHAAVVGFGVAVCKSVYEDSDAQDRCSVGRDDASHVD